MTAKELMEKRGKAIADARAIIAGAKAAGVEPTAEQNASFDRAMEQAAEYKESADRIVALEAAEADLALPQDLAVTPQRADSPKSVTPVVPEAISYRGVPRLMNTPTASKEYNAGFSDYLRSGGVSGALQIGSDTGGGYISPDQFAMNLIQGLDNESHIRRISNVQPPLTTGQSLGVPTLDADLADATWTTELLTGSEDTTLAFGKRELKPSPFAKLVKVSNTLRRQAGMDISGFVQQRMGYKFGITEETAFMTGSGNGQPLGIFTAHANGITTARDVSTSNTATEFTFLGLISAQRSVKAGHRAKATWVFHRDAVTMLAKMTDGEGQFIWRGSVLAAEPDILLGNPIAESEYAPNTFTTGLYVGVFGNFEYYHIVDSLAMTVQVVDQLYAATNQTGYIGRAECDGMPVLDEAFARVKLG